jgi:restriction system protein
VKWIKPDVPRVQIPKDLRNSLGSALTVFQVSKNDAESRIRALLQGKVVEPDIEEDDVDSEAPEQLRVSSLAQNQIVEYINDKFKEHDLARLVEGVLQAQGYRTELSRPGPDGGVDILAGSGPLGFSAPSIAVQVKSGAGPSGSAELNQLKGAMSMFGASHGLFVSWSGFTASARKTARQNFFAIRLWDAEDLIHAIQENFLALPAELKAELPLQQIWALVEDAE